jgi:hypothetical protein
MTDQELKLLSVQAALKKMFESSHFSICTLREAITTMGSLPDVEAMKILTPLHCVDWSNMPPALRNAVPALIGRCLADQWPPPALFDRSPVQVVIQHTERVVEVEKPRGRLFGLIGRNAGSSG